MCGVKILTGSPYKRIIKDANEILEIMTKKTLVILTRKQNRYRKLLTYLNVLMRMNVHDENSKKWQQVIFSFFPRNNITVLPFGHFENIVIIFLGYAEQCLPCANFPLCFMHVIFILTNIFISYVQHPLQYDKPPHENCPICSMLWQQNIIHQGHVQNGICHHNCDLTCMFYVVGFPHDIVWIMTTVAW